MSGPEEALAAAAAAADRRELEELKARLQALETTNETWRSLERQAAYFCALMDRAEVLERYRRATGADFSLEAWAEHLLDCKRLSYRVEVLLRCLTAQPSAGATPEETREQRD